MATIAPRMGAVGSTSPGDWPWMRGRIRLITTGLRDIHLEADDLVLDAAAGDGSLSQIVAAETGGRLLTSDRDPGACLGSRGAGRETLRADIRRLPVRDGAASLTVAFEIIEHFPEWETDAVVDELARVTRPGGRLVLSTPNRLSLKSIRGLGHYLTHGTPWVAEDETHRTLFTRRQLVRALARRFKVERVYGYYLVPEFKQHVWPGTLVVTANRLLVPMCHLLFVVARARPTRGDRGVAAGPDGARWCREAGRAQTPRNSG